MSKTVFITGSSRGIGAAIAKLFYRNGYNVAINYNRSEEEASALSKLLAGSLLLKGDVSKEDDVKEMIAKTVSHFGSIDVLVNNAGISVVNLLTDTTLEEWERLFSINVTGTFLASKYAAAQMIKNHSGRIINISSIWGISGASMESCYSASKGAVIAFTKALAKELGPSGITVNCVAPGFIDTDMNSDVTPEDKRAFCEETPLGRIGTPEEVAKMVLFLASDNADFVTGQIIGCDGGAII
ncbi:MAG: SDR family oxidoreductase [Ruminococcaceae bacterium]|nr:SDR family oxidoreductase [Oscillospiraceae bacterium]